MKKHMLSLGILLGACNASYAMMKVQLPPTDVLSERLQSNDFLRLVTNSDLVRELGGKEKRVQGVILSVDLAIADCTDDVSFIAQQTMEFRKPKLVALILQDHPEAVEEAKRFLEELANN